MDKKILFKKIEENKTSQAQKYYKWMQQVIKNDPYYYKDKKYAKLKDTQ